VQGELLDLVNFVPAFEQAARCLMPEIMEMEVLDAEISTGPVKRLFDARCLVGKDELAGTRLSQSDMPRLRGVPKSAMISEFVCGMFQVADESSTVSRVIIRPSQAANLTLTSS
jgi:hypothetical protein